MPQKSKLLSYSLKLTVYSLILLSSFAYAQDIKHKAPIIVNGDKVEYFHEQKKVIGTGNISIDYEDVRLTCEKVIVYLDTREAIAEGNVKITQKDAYFTGDKMNYNFDTRLGKAINSYVNYVPFYGRSQDVEKVGDNQINIQRGYITTCDLEQPHYRVKAKQVRIYLDDKVIAKHILFYLGNCPIMYLPYYVQPLQEQSAHITVQPGHDRDWGYYALTSLRFDYSQLFRGRFKVDYRTKNGLAFGVDNDYSIPGLGGGIARFYYADEDNDYLSHEPEGRNDGKYRLQVRHKWQVTDDTLFTLELNKVRDDNMIKYYFYKEWEEQGQPDNYLSFVKTAPNYTTTFLYRQRLDKYYTVVQRMPEYTINIPKYNIKYEGQPSPFYYDLNMSAVYLNKTYRQAPPEIVKDERIERIDTYNRLSYSTNPIKFLRSFNITPYAGMSQTYYSRNRWGDTNFMRGALDAGFDSSIKFYKIYDIQTNVLSLDINKLRHVVTPTVNYYYMHQPTVDRDNLYQFDSVDGLAAQNHILLSVENKLQTKRNGAAVDLVDFIISTDYQFRVKQGIFPTFLRDSDLKYNKFQSVDMQLELTPYPWLYALSRMRINTKRQLPESASIDFIGGKEVDRSLAFGYRYERSFDPTIAADPDTNGNIVNYLTTDAIYRFNELWKARVYWRFNLDKGYIDEHQYTVYRDLHCWILEFTYDLRPYQNDKTITDQIFWIALRLKAFPDQPLGLSRTYSRTRAGRPGDPGFVEREKFGAGRSPSY